MKFICHGTPDGGLVPPLEASLSHHTGNDSSGRLIVPAQRRLTHKIQHSQETDTMARRDSNLLPQTDPALSG